MIRSKNGSARAMRWMPWGAVCAAGIMVAGLTPTAGRAQEGAAAAVAKPAPADVVEVEAEGEGVTKEEALKIALRTALEKGGKQEIFSDTRVENFQLMYDTIISRAQGIVTDYKILEEKKIVGGTIKVRIKALVSKSVLHESWGAIQNVLNQIGRPKIMVHIVERIDGRIEEQSILETRVEERLLKSGFDLVARTAIEQIKRKELEDAAATGDTAKMQAIAKDHNAHIFIAGTANANQAGLEVPYGVPIAFYNCDVQVKAYYTDSAKMLASKGIPNTRGGAQGRKEFSPQAGKQALALAGENLVNELYAQIMEQWSTQISAGGELILEVEGIKFATASKLKKALAEIEGVNSVGMKFSKEIATYQINARMGAEDLAERLTEGEFGKLLEIEDLKLNRVQAKAKADTE